nr:hypothetical protein [Chryseobacterium sp. RU37D]
MGTTDAVDFIAKTNNQERLRISSSGNVGIGTTSPAAKLDVLGGVNITSATGNNTLYIIGGNTPTNPRLYVEKGALEVQSNEPVGTNSIFSISQARNQEVTVLANGNVGIGTISPVARLDVAGNVKIADGTQGVGKVLTSDANGLASWQPAASTTDTNIYNIDGTLAANRTVTLGNSNLNFNTNGFGKVGIGTGSPVAKLDVAGNVRIADGTQGVGKVLTSDANGVASWQPAASTTDTNIYNTDGTLAANRTVTLGNSNLNLNTNGFGKVGIGTGFPQKTLHVNGSMQLTNELNVGGSQFSSGNAGAPGQVLTSQGPNASPAWNTLENQGYMKVVFFGEQNFLTQTYAGTHLSGTLANNAKAYSYNNIIKQDNTFITYNNGWFIANKTGLYMIHANTSIDISLNNDTTGTAHSYIEKSNGSKISFDQLAQVGLPTGKTNEVNQHISGMTFLNVGEQFRVMVCDTLDFKVKPGNIYITYVGQ